MCIRTHHFLFFLWYECVLFLQVVLLLFFFFFSYFLCGLHVSCSYKWYCCYFFYFFSDFFVVCMCLLFIEMVLGAILLSISSRVTYACKHVRRWALRIFFLFFLFFCNIAASTRPRLATEASTTFRTTSQIATRRRWYVCFFFFPFLFFPFFFRENE